MFLNLLPNYIVSLIMNLLNIVLITIFIVFTKSELILLVNEKDKLASCVGTENDVNSTLAWFENEEPSLQKPTNIFETFEINDPDEWKTGHSFHFNLGIISDERWEEFETVKLTRSKSHVVQKTDIKYLPISLYLVEEVKFLFYKDNTPYTTQLILKKSGWRILFGNDCIKTESTSNPYKVWSHVYFIFGNSTITIKHNDIEFKFDLPKSESINKIEVLSNNSFLKIHEYNFKYTTKEMSAHTVSSINTKNRYLSMFVSICSGCTMGIIFDDKTEFEFSNKETKQIWEKLSTNKKLCLQVWSKLNDHNNNAFFSIHAIKTFDIDYRNSTIKKISKNISCLNLHTNRNITATNLLTNKTCKSGYFGQQCNINFKVPPRFKICEETNQCYCNWGYRGASCDQECKDGHWGINCSYKCGNCLNSEICDKSLGICKKCKKDYFGKFCTITEDIKPIIEDYSYEWIKLVIKNIKDLETERVMCEYQEIGKPELVMEIQANHNDTYYFCNVTDLKAGKKYNIKAVLYYKTKYFYENIFSINQTTKCDKIRTSNIRLFQHKNDAVEMFLEPINSLCLDEINSVSCSNGKVSSVTEFPVIFNNLLKGQNYTFNFSKRILSITYQLLPSDVIAVVNKTNGTISWDDKGRNLSKYSVKYQLTKNACDNNAIQWAVPDSKEVQEPNRTVFLDNLRPFSQYEYYIIPSSQPNGTYIYGYHGHFVTSSDELSNNELPKNVAIENEEIVITQCDCNELKGNITYIIDIRCHEEWCDEDTIQEKLGYDFHLSKISIPIPDLKHAFSNYSVQVSVSRNKQIPYQHKIYFRTKPTKPSAIRNGIVYSSTNQSIWIRWLEPYPPTGKIVDYNITINTTSSQKISVYKKTVDCKFWPNFTCYQVNVVEKNATYSIGISALNENVKNASEEVFLFPSPQEGLLNIEDLRAQFDGGFMLVKWKVPNFLNGATSFLLNVSVIRSENNETDQINIIPLENVIMCGTYVCTKVNSSFSTEFKIAVSLKSDSAGLPKIINITTPPSKPFFPTKPYVGRCTKDSCKLILPILKNFSNNCTIYIYTSRVESRTQFDNKLIQEDINKLINNNSYVHLKTMNCTLSNSNLIINITGFGNSTSNNNLTILVLNEFGGKFNWTMFNVNFQVTNSETVTIIMIFIICVISVIFVTGISVILRFMFCRRTENGNQCISGTSCSCNTNSKVNEEQYENLPLNKSKRTKNVEKKKKIAVNKIIPSHEINMKNFENYLKKSLKELNKQHTSIELVNKQLSADESKKSANTFKNRESKYHAYDHSRVILKNHQTNYIHANFIHGYNKENKYIATQSPKTNTINDFWHMIWQEKIQFIIVLIDFNSNESKKYIQYWPNEFETITFDNYVIKNIRIEMKTNYYVNYLKIEGADECRLVKHFHFMDWPDNGVPLYPNILIPFFEEIRGIEFSTHPLVVHCSNGTNNTGTFILCDIAFDMIAQKSSVDFLNILSLMRNQRMGVIEKCNQYILSHYLVYEYMYAKDFLLVPEMFSKAKYDKFIQSNGVKDVIKYLNQTNWKRDVLEMITETVLPSLDTEINYVCVNNFKSSNTFILMKCEPKKETENFWKLLWHYNVQLVVYLNDFDNNKIIETTIWPKENTKQYISNVGEIECRNESEANLLIVKIVNEQESRVIKFLSANNGWSTNSHTPVTPKCLLDVQEDIYNLCNSYKSPIVIMCHDGITACGLFIASALLVKKIKMENTIDVVLAVQHAQMQCKKFVENEKQIEFLYKTAFEYISTKDMYTSI